MGHPQRHDERGAIHHVMNRSVGRRALFESTRDVRHFLSLVARAVHRGEIELLAYAVMTTHFHLLVRTRSRSLAETIGWIEREYVRAFNRRRDRDGPLFRGRFLSRRIDHPLYLRAAFLYIERNPVDAGMAARADDYEWSSARARRRPRTPRWLRRDPELEQLAHARSSAESDPDWLVARRIEEGERTDGDAAAGPAPELLDAGPGGTLEWLRRRTADADGTKPGLVVAAPAALGRALLVPPVAPAPLDPIRKRARSTSAVLQAGLLRQLCGFSFSEIGAQMRISGGAARNAVQRHGDRVQHDPRYAAWAAEVATAAIAMTLQR